MRDFRGWHTLALILALFAFSSVLLLSCLDGRSSKDLPENLDPRTIAIAPPPDDYIWARAGGDPASTGVSNLDGPESFETAWAADIGESPALSPVIDSAGNIYAACLGGNLVGLTPEGKERFRFGEGKDETEKGIEVRCQPTLGEGQVWVGALSGLICLDFDGNELFRFSSEFLPKEGISNLAISPTGGIVFSTRDGSIILLDRQAYPVAVIKTRGDVSMPASFDNDGNAYLASSDQNLYRIGPKGRLHWKFNARGALIATPVLGKNIIFAASMDGKIYGVNYNGRERWRMGLIFDAESQETLLRKEDENAIVGLYWPPILTDREPERDGEEPANEALVGIVDRPKRLADASYIFAWVKEDGTIRQRKQIAESFFAGVSWGTPPVMDAAGRVYIGVDNKIVVTLGRNVIGEYTIAGKAKVSGAQPVITSGKRLLIPMDDGRLVCLQEASMIKTEDKTGDPDGQEELTDDPDGEEELTG